MTDEEFDAIWSDDLLGRKEDGRWLSTFLSNRSQELSARDEKRSFVLNLDASWGGGKTFFLERFQKQLEAENNIVAYVNAWRDDFAEDPLLAVMASIDQAIPRNEELSEATRARWDTLKRSGGEVARIVGKGLAKRVVGLVITQGAVAAAEAAIGAAGEIINPLADEAMTAIEATSDEVSKAVTTLFDRKAEAAVSEFQAELRAIQAFKVNLARFIAATAQEKGVAKPFFILIDELDRCRPPYAIALLERVKHLFETPNVVFVVATDSRQLGHSIKAVYGNDFESERYLKRFFDRTFLFEAPDVSTLVNHLVARYPISADRLSAPIDIKPHDFIAEYFNAASYDLRSVGQIYHHLRDFVSGWSSPLPVELIIALPMVAACHAKTPIDTANELRKIFTDFIPEEWKITFHSYRTGEMAALSVKSAAVRYWENAKDFVRQVESNNRSHPDRFDEWVWRRNWDEYTHRMNGKPIKRGASPVGYVRQYPELIRRAGRVTTTQE